MRAVAMGGVVVAGDWGGEWGGVGVGYGGGARRRKGGRGVWQERQLGKGGEKEGGRGGGRGGKRKVRGTMREKRVKRIG